MKAVVHQGGRGLPGYEELPGYIIEADASVYEIDPADFDALLLPGARAPEYLRNIDRVNEVVRHFLDTNKPIGAICHGPHLLLSAGVTGRRMTAVDGIKTEVALAGNTYVDAGSEPVLDRNILTVSRRPYYDVWMREFMSMLKERRLAGV